MSCMLCNIKFTSRKVSILHYIIFLRYYYSLYSPCSETRAIAHARAGTQVKCIRYHTCRKCFLKIQNTAFYSPFLFYQDFLSFLFYCDLSTFPFDHYLSSFLFYCNLFSFLFDRETFHLLFYRKLPFFS